MTSKSTEKKSFSGREARQGEIILRTPARRLVFVLGLAGFVALAILAGLLL